LGVFAKKTSPLAVKRSGDWGLSKSPAQRAATYIVISKPKRKSVAVGVCHCM
jgi:hypothetical protein